MGVPPGGAQPGGSSLGVSPAAGAPTGGPDLGESQGSRPGQPTRGSLSRGSCPEDPPYLIIPVPPSEGECEPPQPDPTPSGSRAGRDRELAPGKNIGTGNRHRERTLAPGTGTDHRERTLAPGTGTGHGEIILETGQVFNSPSAWATHCKRLVNPAKKSGCGWASVRYRGQRLDQYKAAWLRRHQPHAPPPDEGLASEGEEEEMPEEEEEEAAREGGRLPLPEPTPPKKPEERSKKQQCKSPAEPAGADPGAPGKRLETKPRVPVRYCTLGTRDSARNPQTLVEVTSFAAINKFQPFNVAISSNVLLLLDFHSHLTRSEVVGYLGGRWDTNTQLLTVLRAFPCRTRLGDAEAAGAVEEEVKQPGEGAAGRAPGIPEDSRDPSGSLRHRERVTVGTGGHRKGT
ncbi:MPN domain-containing protein [Corapipo altera]|uniref:MPN domain-containing protein n=1 Tax=Corapipo altera TaxID=415028 RepID=UPI000FD64B97|nr:MPN domain-containing protein [Corapipo altera]